jgi:hypothetical protein
MLDGSLSDGARVLAGILFISLVTVETGGLYMVKVVTGRAGGLTPFQVAFSRAGHAHAGVLLILALVCILFTEATDLSGFWLWLARSGVAVAALLMPAGFFFSSMGANRERPNSLVWLVYAGGVVLAVALLVLGVGLLTAG